MSDTDSFIEEVSEEVRRDNLFRIFRKYGWIAIAAVVLLVGGAAYNEWSKSKARSDAQSAGDQILGALQESDAGDRAAALGNLTTGDSQGAILGLLLAAESLNADEKADAIAALTTLAADAETPAVYSHLAELKILLIEGKSLTPEDRLARLAPLAIPGAPYRLLAEEQIGLAHLDAGDTTQAADVWRAILLDTEVTIGQRRRVSQLIIAVGGELDAA